jgi:hypothetical protein
MQIFRDRYSEILHKVDRREFKEFSDRGALELRAGRLGRSDHVGAGPGPKAQRVQALPLRQA